MPAQPKSAIKDNSRRDFMKRVILGVAAATGAALAAGKLVGKGSKSGPLPGPGSIFEPRSQDLTRHWGDKLGRFRLR
jgi:hypothetical protein